MRAKGHALTTVDTDHDITLPVPGNGSDWTGIHAITALDAGRVLKEHTASLAGRQGSGGTDCSTFGISAGKTMLGDKTRRKAARALDADTGMVPGNQAVHQAGAGKGTGMATNAAVHVRGCQNLHCRCSKDKKQKRTNRGYQV